MPAAKYEHFKRSCQDYGIKSTSQRFIIFDTLKENCSHPTADQIFDDVSRKLPSLSRDTVYRTLNLLSSCGLANKLGLPGGATRFDGNIIPHHHFLCEKCDKIFDINWPELNDLGFPDSALNLGMPRCVSVVIHGICRQCQKHITS